MKEVFQSGSLAAFKIKKAVRFNQDVDELETTSSTLDHQTGSNGDADEDDCSALCGKLKDIQRVKPIIVEEIKCRSHK